MSTTTTGTIQTQDKVPLHYTQHGPPTAPAMLLIPGWRQTAAQWRKQVHHFSQTHRVTTYDHRGHGSSGKPTHGHRVTRYAADLAELLTQLDLHAVVIIAHSMGASVVWALWDTFPNLARSRLSKLVLVDQAACMVRNPTWSAEQARERASIFTPESAYELADNMGARSAGLVRSMFTAGGISEAELEWVLERNATVSDETAAALFLDHAFMDWRDVLPRITDVPTLIVAPEGSLFPAVGVRWLATQIPGARVLSIGADEGGSHFCFWENPEKFNAAVEEFMKS